MTRSRTKCETIVSYQVSFKLPQGLSTRDARTIIEDKLVESSDLKIGSPLDVKVHLVNKEIKYGQSK